MNLVVLAGRVGRDPETRYTQGGKTVCNLSLATNGFSGGRKTTEWHKLVVWEKTAELVQRYVRKGSFIMVEGRITYREWRDKDENKRTVTEIVVNRVDFGPRVDAEQGGGREPGDDGDPRQVAEGRAAEIPDEDIPF